MSLAAWTMLITASFFLYGGLIFCVRIAMRASQAAPQSERTDAKV